MSQLKQKTKKKTKNKKRNTYTVKDIYTKLFGALHRFNNLLMHDLFVNNQAFACFSDIILFLYKQI